MFSTDMDKYHKMSIQTSCKQYIHIQCTKQSRPTLKPYNSQIFGAEIFWKHGLKQNFLENMKSINSLILLEEFDEKMQTNICKILSAATSNNCIKWTVEGMLNEHNRKLF